MQQTIGRLLAFDLRGAAAGLSGNLRGMLWMLVASFAFAAMHAVVRHVSAELHPFEVAFFRNAFGLLALAPWFMRRGLEPLRTQRFGFYCLRAGLNIVAMLSFFYALSITPLAQVTALGFTAPIFATVLAVLLLGEVVRIRRWLAIAFGFAGTLVILQPGVTVPDLGSLLVVFSSAVWGLTLIVIKHLARTDSSVTITAYMVLLMAPLSLVPAVFVWQWPDLAQWAWLAVIGVLGTLAQMMMSQALKEADTNVVMPLDFSKLIYAALLGYVLFAEVPSIATWIGGAMIFASTLYIAFRERRLALAAKARAAAPPSAPPG